MTREETVRKLLTELIDMIDNGSQRDLDRADEIGASIIKLFEQEPIDYKTKYENYLKKSEIVISQLRADRDRLLKVIDKIRAEVEQTRKMYLDMNDIDWLNGCDYVLSVIDKYKAEKEE